MYYALAKLACRSAKPQKDASTQVHAFFGRLVQAFASSLCSSSVNARRPLPRSDNCGSMGRASGSTDRSRVVSRLAGLGLCRPARGSAVRSWLPTWQPGGPTWTGSYLMIVTLFRVSFQLVSSRVKGSSSKVEYRLGQVFVVHCKSLVRRLVVITLFVNLTAYSHSAHTLTNVHVLAHSHNYT